MGLQRMTRRIAVAALRAGAADYVIKDISEDFTALLRSALEQALERQQLQRQNDEAQEQVRLSRDRAEAMLREVNHRVGNSLQLVSSFISLQMRQVDDEAARTALRDAQARIGAVADVHRRLYSSDDMSRVAIDEYLGGLIDELGKSLGSQSVSPTLVLDAVPLAVSPDHAVGLGMIVTELVTNAVKYAYAPGAGGEIRVLLRLEADHRAVLTVEDDGCGMKDAPPRGTGLGRRIITAMASGLGSQVEFDPDYSVVRARLAFSF